MNMPSLHRFCILYLCLISSSVAFGQVAAGITLCGEIDNPYGPYDYRTQRSKLKIVEQFHFDAGVETLTKSKGARFGGDIDYTLRASPNHHRALLTLTSLVMREKTKKPKGSRYTVDCWFNRAERFAPDDAMVKVIYGIYLIRAGHHKAAVESLEKARALDSTNGNVHYNLGLAYFELGQHQKALESAHRAYAAGFPLPGLRQKLTKAGKWREDVKVYEEGAKAD